MSGFRAPAPCLARRVPRLVRLVAGVALAALLSAGGPAALEREAAAAAPEETPPFADLAPRAAGETARLVVVPAEAALRGGESSLQLVVTGVDAAGGVRDLTLEASYAVDDPALALVQPGGLVTPLADGATRILVRAAGQEAAVAVAVSHTGIDLPLNFANDIIPIFSKSGCNAGGCHGKSGGQNGFAMSLFGFTPELDYKTLVHESRGRRVFPAAPEHSLLLRKATGALPHGGGERFAAGSLEYRLVHRWIRSGMPWGRPDDPALERIEVYPRHRVLERRGRQQLAVTAFFKDGGREDVTRMAQFSVEEPDYLEVTPEGRVASLDVPGQGVVLVRFKGRVAFFRATVPSGVDITSFPRPEARNVIDRHVFARLEALGIPPSRLANDAEFLRRASIDVSGTLPTAAEARSFLEDQSPDKRERLVDDLLERPAYASYFALLWADVLRNRRGEQERAAPLTIRFHRWVYESLVENKPFDRFVRELLCAEGNIADTPAVGWYRFLERPTALVDDAAQVFLGTRMQCARCHHHPFEKWGQEDYWHFANFFSRLARKEESDSRDFTISVERRESRLTDDEPTSASYRKTYSALQVPGGEAIVETPDGDPREVLADWMTSPENPLFARALVNRYWKHFFGRGIVEPEDDLRETNPPSNPELLEALAADFVAHGYDLKRLIRTICGSATYQLSSEPNEHNRADRQSFARFQPRRLPAEVLLDAVNQVAGATTKFRNARRGARAIELPDEGGRSYFLDVFGKPERGSACACERSGDVTLAQVLHILNSREVVEKVGAAEGRPALLAADERPDGEKVCDLFLAAFARPPSAEEEARALAHLEAAADKERSPASRRRAWEDLVWALLNTKEFLFNR
jgi:hypothetical protein